MRRRFLKWTQRLGVTLPTGGQAGELSLGAQQTIEIIRALEQNARIVFMDEPTSSLGPEERLGLFRMIDSMRKRGIAIVFISHKLDDVLAAAKTVTVLRDGERVARVEAANASPDDLIQAMLGKALEDVLEQHTPTVTADDSIGADEALRVWDLAVPGVLHDINLDVRRGEIVGVAGLVGSGRSTLLHALAGAAPTASGRMRVGSATVAWPRSPRQARAHGIALAPEDRRMQGLVLSLSAGENLMLSSAVPHSRFGVFAKRRLFDASREAGARVGFSEQRVGAPARTLSRVAISRSSSSAGWLPTDPRSYCWTSPGAASTSAPRLRFSVSYVRSRQAG